MDRSYDRVAIARPVLLSRRITLPQQLGLRAQLAKETHAVWSRAGDSRVSLMLRGGPGQSDASRRISSVWQITIPPTLMDQVELAVGDWVYLKLGTDKRSIRVTPARHVDIGTSLQEPA